MEDRDDLQTVPAQSVGNHVRCARQDQLSRTGYATGATQVRQVRETLDGLEQCDGDSIGSFGIVTSDVLAETSQMLDGSRTRR